MIAYFDTSAVVPLFVGEVGSSLAKSLWESADRVVSARLVYPETRAALARAQRAGRITTRQLRAIALELEVFYGHLHLVDLDDDLAHRAGDLAETHGLRGGGAVHLAAAAGLQDLDLVVVAGDAALLGAASAEGMTIATVV